MSTCTGKVVKGCLESSEENVGDVKPDGCVTEEVNSLQTAVGEQGQKEHGDPHDQDRVVVQRAITHGNEGRGWLLQLAADIAGVKVGAHGRVSI